MAEYMLLGLIYIIVLVFLPLLLTLKHFIRGRTHKGADLWKALIEGPVQVGQELRTWRRQGPHQENFGLHFRSVDFVTQVIRSLGCCDQIRVSGQASILTVMCKTGLEGE